MPLKKCDLCEREFGSYQGLLQHYADKHPAASPPKDVIKKDALRKKKRVNGSRPHRRNRLLIISAIVILIIVIAGVGVYYSTRPDVPLQQHTSSVSSSGTVYGINVGNHAPNIPITLTNGTSTNLSNFSGHIVLLYFVATWCPSCQQAAQLLNQQYYSELHAKGVIILTIELYNDLNQQGPSIQQFADQYGTGKEGWLFGTSTQSATYTYDPNANLEAYYLIDPSGVIIMTTGYAGLANDLPSVVSAA